jgi:hypothetical protein
MMMRWTMSSFAFAGARLSRPLPSPVVAFSSLSGVLCVRSVPMGTSAIARYVMMMRRNGTPPDTVLAAINPMRVRWCEDGAGGARGARVLHERGVRDAVSNRDVEEVDQQSEVVHDDQLGVAVQESRRR